MDALGWFVTAIAILLTGISKAGLGGALGRLAVPFMSMWIPPRDAVAVVLPILIVMDMVGIRVWRGKADRGDLRHLIPAWPLGIGAGTLLFGVLSDRMVEARARADRFAFVADRLLRRRTEVAAPGERRAAFAWLCGAGAGFTSTLAHAGGPPIMAYLLSRGLPKALRRHLGVLLHRDQPRQAALYLGIGLFSRDTLLMSAMLCRSVPVGVWLDLRLLRRIPSDPSSCSPPGRSRCRGQAAVGRAGG